VGYSSERYSSYASYNEKYGHIFKVIEWVFTILFTIEFVARMVSVQKPMKYVFSFFGVVDIISILPSYLMLLMTVGSSFQIVRILRLLRVFRVLKLIGFIKEAVVLRNAIIASRQKLIIFMLAVVMLVIMLGTVMYIIEDQSSGFTSIPRSIYWAIVTLTTVGYGDIAPRTALGQSLASIIMILGYAIIAVPTGIVTSEALSKSDKPTAINTQRCEECGHRGHDDDAVFCKHCGYKL
jgi:voltage-gated potassium channel